jgi:exosortase/archaeosortase family protein
MRPLNTISPLLRRGIVFLGLFVAVSGLMGPRIISGGILFRDGFAFYGGFGKAAIFGVIAFVLLVHHNKLPADLQPWRPALLGWIAASGLAFSVGWVSIGNLLAGRSEVQNLAGAHGGLLLCILFAVIGCFGPRNLKMLWRSYKRELAASIVLAGAFYAFLLAVYALWRPLASVVLLGVKGLLAATGLHAIVVPPHSLMFDKFGITIAQYCSGIESIALFSGLYAIVGLLDWPRLNLQRYFMVFPLALGVLFALNIVRVFVLILVGYHINPVLAFSLFHTYAGLLFFVLYSAAFWMVAYKHFLKPYSTSPHPSRNHPISSTKRDDEQGLKQDAK